MAEEDVFERLAESQAAVDHAAATGLGEQPWSAGLVMFLSTSILAVVALALGLATLLLWKRSAGGQDILRVYGVIIIVGLSTLLLIVGFDNDQLTPIIGLFGAIAGYLLGKDSGTGGGTSVK